MELQDFIKYAKNKGFYSAYFLKELNGEKLYAIQKYENAGAFTGAPIILKERNNKIVELLEKEKYDFYLSCSEDED